MKIPVTARVIAVIALCLIAVPITGSAPECPKPCIIEGTDCAPTCGDPITMGVCVEQTGGLLKCEPKSDKSPKPAP